MSKSSSGGGNEGSRSSSVEYEETNQQPINIQALMNSNTRLETNVTSEDNVLSIRNEPLVPNSPPPSYEHVLEETRMAVGQSATNNTDDEIRSENGNNDIQNVSDGDRTPGRGGGGGGGGNKGGPRTPIKGPEILHKSSKELYRAVAKQWGITCKMSDQCRCFDCQSHYFDCEYERDEQSKIDCGDGGLGAGAPMFLSEVMHGTACTII